MHRTRRRLLPVLALTTVLATAMVAPALAQDGPTAADVGSNLNLLWVVIGAALVIFMQAGFAMVETGFTRAKHAAHVVTTNFAVFGLGAVAFFLVGYALMFGGFSLPGVFGFDQAIGSPLVGSGHWTFLYGGWKAIALSGLHDPALAAPIAAFFLYMVAFMDTTATIPTGAMAERWKWKAFVGWGLFCGAIYYPLFGAWTWGGGWLSQLGNSLHLGLGYVDFAGSGIVHATGGFAGLAGAIVLGPRIGKYAKDGKARAMPGHNIPMAMLGTFILLFGWFGFNAASTFAATDIQFATVATNTALAAAFGSVATMVFLALKGDKPDPSMLANGMLAGLVAITAPCAFVDPWAAATIGIVAGVLVVVVVDVVQNRGIDDPVGAFAVHGANGIWGVLAVGVFGNGVYGAGWNGTTAGAAASANGVTGVLYDPSVGLGQLAAQAIGALVIATVMFGLAYTFFRLQARLTKGGIRSEEADEIAGLDLPEMGVLAYPPDLPVGGAETVGAAESTA